MKNRRQLATTLAALLLGAVTLGAQGGIGYWRNGAGTYASAPLRVNNAVNGSIVIGNLAGAAMTWPDALQNVLIGYRAGENLTTADDIVAIGWQAWALGISATDTIAIGRQAGYGGCGGSVFVGIEAGVNCGIGGAGSGNIGIGKFALNTNQNGENNTCVGRGCLQDFAGTAVPTYNTSAGFDSGRGITTGVKNTIVGALCNPGNVSNNIALCDGDGNKRLWMDATGNTALQGPVLPKVVVATLTTAGAVTYTSAEFLGEIILRNPNGLSRSDVSPTAALLRAALPTAVIGTRVDVWIRNTAGAAETITMTAGTGATLSGTMTIAQNNTKHFKAVFTNVTPASEAYTLYSMGTFVH